MFILLAIVRRCVIFSFEGNVSSCSRKYSCSFIIIFHRLVLALVLPVWLLWHWGLSSSGIVKLCDALFTVLCHPEYFLREIRMDMREEGQRPTWRSTSEQNRKLRWLARLCSTRLSLGISLHRLIQKHFFVKAGVFWIRDYLGGNRLRMVA